MKKILIGCPYDMLQDFNNSLVKFKGKNDLIFDSKDITFIDDKFIYFGKNFEKHNLNSFTGVFIRYPYDLIDPFTETYQKREDTEFLKTIALLFNDISLNPILDAHFTRNRLYSLKMARKSGLKTPESFIIKKNNFKINFNNKKITKSLGNCYFSDNLSKKEEDLKKYLSFEKDGEDTAYIYEPHIIKNNKELHDHLIHFKTLLIQNKIEGKEYRVFVVNKKIFVYQRDEKESLDKSSCGLIKIKENIFKKYKEKIIKLTDKLNLKYLCMDIILTTKDAIILDINPYGSFPKYKFNPEVVDSLAKLILIK